MKDFKDLTSCRQDQVSITLSSLLLYGMKYIAIETVFGLSVKLFAVHLVADGHLSVLKAVSLFPFNRNVLGFKGFSDIFVYLTQC